MIAPLRREFPVNSRPQALALPYGVVTMVAAVAAVIAAVVVAAAAGAAVEEEAVAEVVSNHLEYGSNNL